MSDADFLRWIADRLVNVYHESPRTDFVTKLQGIAAAMEDAAMTHQHWCETQRPYSGDVKPGCTCQPTPPSLREQVEQLINEEFVRSSFIVSPEFVDALTQFALAQRREQAAKDAEIARTVKAHDRVKDLNWVCEEIATAIERDTEGKG